MDLSPINPFYLIEEMESEIEKLKEDKLKLEKKLKEEGVETEVD